MKIIPFCVLLLFAACQQAGNPNDAKNTANIKAAYDAFNQRNWDALAALCDGENFTELNVAPTPAKGVQNAIELYKQFATGFPDFKVAINEMAPVGNNRYVLCTTVTGTNTGEFMGIPPTGKAIHFDDADLVEVNAEGKAISHAVTNVGEPLRQIGYASMMNPATQVVMQAFEKFGKGDIEGVLALCDDKVVFDIEEHSFGPQASVYNGKSEAGKFFQELGSRIKYTKFQTDRFVAEGDEVVAFSDAEYIDNASGKSYAINYVHHFKMSNGKVAYFSGWDNIPKPK